MNEQKMSDVAMLNEVAQTPLQSNPNYFEGEDAKLKRFILENDETILPANMKKNLWVFTDKELALSNLDAGDIKRNLLWLDVAKIDYMMAKPDYTITFEEMQDIDQMRVKAFVKMKRSFGGSDRERVLMASEFREFRTPERKGEGILDRIFGGARR